MKPLASLLQRLETSRVPAPLQRPLRRLRLIVNDFVRCDLLAQSSSMAYGTLLSLVPSLVAVVCVLSLFSPLVGKGRNLETELQDFLIQNLASDNAQKVVQYLESMLSHVSVASIGWSSFASMLITLILLLRQIEGALNRIWLVHKGRNLFTRFMYFWTFLTLGVLGLGVVIGVTAGFDLHKLFGNDGEGSGVPGWLAGTGAVFTFFFVLYKVGPNCFVAGRNAAVGALAASVLLNQGGRLYGIYIKDASNYQSLYGALAQLPIFLMWLYICWIIVLLGALITWRMQEGFPAEEEEDSLDGATRPLELLRNAHVRAALPWITLVAVYQQFARATGRGLSAQQLAHALKLPTSWIAEALDALDALGYVVPGRADTTGDGVGSVTDPFFPAYPAAALPLSRVHADLRRPMTDWLGHWHHELPVDMSEALRRLAPAPLDSAGRSFADALADLPSSGAQSLVIPTT